MALVTRTWHREGGWPWEVVAAFSRLMGEAEETSRGRSALVKSWDDGRGVSCWYTATTGKAERTLAVKVARAFGCPPTASSVDTLAL